MFDIIMCVRFGIENKKTFSEFVDWLNKENGASSYNKYAVEFAENILRSTQLTPSATIQISHSAHYDYLETLRHPILGKSGKWFLDDLQLNNGQIIWIKLENQWIKGKIKIDNKVNSVFIEPENVLIPLSKELFLRF